MRDRLPFSRAHRALSLAIVASAVTVFAAAPACAQGGGGSTYSIFNIGDIQHGSTAAGAGRAGVESAVPTSTLINSINPAGWQDLKMTTLQAALNFEQYKVSDASAAVYQNNSRLQDFAAGFPFSEKLGGAVAFALHPYSSVNYRTRIEQSVPDSDTSMTTMRTDFTGRGGISEGYIGASIRPAPWLSVGATANVFFGAITSEDLVSFVSNRLNPASHSTSNRYFGFGGRVGLQAQPMDDLRLGAVYETGGDLDRERIRSTNVIDNGNSIPDTLSISSATLHVPSRLTFGAALTTGRFLIAADASLQSWGPAQFTTARPENRFALGFERLPNTSINATGFERWTFRLGGYYEQTYYQTASGAGIDQMAVTLGLRWPITSPNAFNSSTALDLGIELGQRGTTDPGLTRELFGRFTIQLSVNELWFVRSRR